MAPKENARWQAGAEQTTCKNGTAESLTQGKVSDPKLSPGTNYSLCRGCGQYFGGADGFTRHRINFQCVEPATLGLALNARGYWVRAAPKVAAVHGGEPIVGGARIPPRTGVQGSAA